MKKLYYLLAGIAMILVTIVACEKSSIGVDEMQTLQKQDVAAKPLDKVTICHYDWEVDEYYQLSVNGNSVDKHMENHQYNDDYDGVTVPGGINHDSEPNFSEVLNGNGIDVPYSYDDFDGDGIADCSDCSDGINGSEKTFKYYRDADGDGFGDPSSYILKCKKGKDSYMKDGYKYILDGTDCDDNTAAILGEYIFEWNAPNGYKHYVNIDSYNQADGTFTGKGYFIFISHSSSWADGNEPLTISGTIDKDSHTFTGYLNYDNNSGASFNGTISACDGLTGNNILIYPYIDNDGDGYSVDEGDCNDDIATTYPGADEICGNGIDDNCDGNTDENDYSPEGTYTIYRGNGSYLKNVNISHVGEEYIITGDGIHAITKNKMYYYGKVFFGEENSVRMYIWQYENELTTVQISNLDWSDGDFTGRHEIGGYVTQCGGLVGPLTELYNGADYSFEPFEDVDYPEL